MTPTQTKLAYEDAFLRNPQGRKVLRDLQQKFSHARLRFAPKGEHSVPHAAFLDGQCSVLAEIEAALTAARPGWDKPSYLADENDEQDDD